MAMTLKTEGLTEVSALLAKLGDKAEAVASGALYDGADVIADAMTAAVDSIKTEEFRYGTPANRRLPSPEEKAALTGKVGVARFRKNGSEVDTMVGISGRAGCADVGGHPKAVRLIARSINSGTSFMQKQPVFRKAKSSAKTAAEQAIISKAEKLFNEIING